MSKLLVSCDHYVFCYNNKYFLKESGIVLLERYLSVFSSIRFAVRVKYVNSEDELGIHSFELKHKEVEVFELPFFQGPKQYLTVYLKTLSNLKKVTEGCSAAILRLPSTVGFEVLKRIKKKQIPFAIEVIANPLESAKLTKSKINYFLLMEMHRKLKKAVNDANGVSYVTKSTLQKIYPTSKRTEFESYYSSVELPDDFYFKPRTLDSNEPFVLCHVSNQIKSHNKGYLIAIQTLKILKENGIKNVSLKFAGYGELIPELTDYSKELEVEESVEFVGHLTFNELRTFLLSSNLMILPTVSEGLPRCIIEAGATGLPCISTPVGGIPELLPNNLLFKPKDAQQFASSVISIIEDKKLYEKISKDLFEMSQEFNRTVLTNRRTQFYRQLQSSQKINQSK